MLLYPRVDHFSSFFKGPGLYAQENTSNNALDRESSDSHGAADNQVNGDSHDIRKFEVHSLLRLSNGGASKTRLTHAPTEEGCEHPRVALATQKTSVGRVITPVLHHRDLATDLPLQLDGGIFP